jgi:multidrug efflux system outer membrane protein
MKHDRSTMLVAAIVLGSCTMIPPYERPAMPVPDSFAQEVADAPAATDVEWKEFVTDERMTSVIDLALANNRDFRVSALNVEKAAAYYRIQRSDLYPAVGVGVFGEKVRIPENMTESGNAEYSEQYSVSVGTISWEIDFFGRIRSLKAASLARYLATEEAQRAAHISLVSAVASSYLALAADEENLRLAEATLEAQLRSADLIRRSHDAGIANGLDVHQAQSQVEASRANLARFKGAVAVGRNVLDLLVGTPVPTALLPDGLESVGAIKDVSPGLSSDVLLARPDILASEQQLVAANANIGAARAAFFPSVTLTAGTGSMDSSLSGLFDSGTRTWSFVPQILAPIFASGSLRANLEAAEIDREIAVAQYEKAIQVAFSEVSNSLALRETLVEQENAQRALANELDAAYHLFEARYQAGLEGYLGVLVAERATYDARRALVGVRLARQANLVELYKVLGGGL